MNTLNPVQAIFGAGGTSPYSGLTGGTGLSSFQSIIDATADRRTAAENAELQYLNTKYQVEQVAWNLGSTFSSSSLLGSSNSLFSFALRDMTAPGGSLSLPSWVNDAQRVMGDAFPTEAVSLYKQAQGMLTGGSTFSTLF